MSKRRTRRCFTPDQFADMVRQGYKFRQYKDAHTAKEYRLYLEEVGITIDRAKHWLKMASRLYRDPENDESRLRHIASLSIPVDTMVRACYKATDLQLNEFIDAYRLCRNQGEPINREEADAILDSIILQPQPTLFSEDEDTAILKETLAQLQATAKDLEDKIKQRLDNAVRY